MIFKFIAPFKTDLNLKTFMYLNNELEYRSFWNHVFTRLQHQFTSAAFLHSSLSENQQKFQKIMDDSSKLNQAIILIQDHESFGTIFSQTIPEIGSVTTMNPESVSFINGNCKLFDNNIGIVELDIDIHLSFHSFLDKIDEIQEISNLLMNAFIEKLHTDLISPLVYAINKVDKNQKFLEITSQETDQKVCPLWVNRTLFTDMQEEEKLNLLILKWLAVGEERVDEVSKDLKNDQIYLGWGHNLFLCEQNHRKSLQAIEALSLCQYYNAVLEYVNTDLSSIVGETFIHTKVNKKTKNISQKLNHIISSTKLLLMELNEVEFNLQGFKQYFFLDLIKKWNIHKLRLNIEEKMIFCNEKVQEIYQQQTKRNQLITETILFGIGGVALIDFFSNVSQFSFTLLTNQDKHLQYRIEGLPGFIELASMVAPDGMIWSGFILLFFTFIFYILFKSRSS